MRLRSFKKRLKLRKKFVSDEVAEEIKRSSNFLTRYRQFIEGNVEAVRLKHSSTAIVTDAHDVTCEVGKR